MSAAEDYSSVVPETTWAERREELISMILAGPGSGPYTEMVRLSAGQKPDEGCILPAIEKMEQRRDCADFGMNGLIPLMYRFGESPLLRTELKARIRKTFLVFKYWPDEPGIDSMCTWTENHQIMFATGGYLAGQLYPDDVFTNSGLRGADLVSRFVPRIERWLELRYKTGFSEWLSNVYYNEDFPPLFNLIQHSKDETIAKKASMVVDLMLLDLALNHYRGTLGSTHGRAYEKGKKDGDVESTGSVLKMLCGLNRFQIGNMSAINMALTDRYRVPKVIGKIASDIERNDMENRQRMGIRIREEVNICTYRTPDFMLSSAQEHRKGYGGDQQHVWQATLGPRAVVFTTHPAKEGGDDTESSPNYWTGSGNLPKVGQTRNVAIVLYRISTAPGLYLTHRLKYTHAWFPTDEFDEVVERGGWVFGRKEDGYVGLWSRNRYEWMVDRESGCKNEIRADGKKNVFICETGRRDTHGAFGDFVGSLSRAKIRCRGLTVSFDSPSRGRLRFGWSRRLTENGVPVKTKGYPRYENPYVKTEYPAGGMEIRCGGEWLRLDWEMRERESSGFIG